MSDTTDNRRKENTMSRVEREETVKKWVVVCEYCHQEIVGFNDPHHAGEKLNYFVLEVEDKDAKGGYITLHFHQNCIKKMWEASCEIPS